MRLTMMRQLTSIQEENQKKLDVIQNTVNEKLETQLQKSFKLVSERLEKGYESLGEMQSIASGVGDLKKVLSNVKTRGILGEIQLGSILEEILAPELYETEVATVPNSREHVEYAVKLPGAADGTSIYLPIDSKFPGDTYAALQEAYESGDKERVDAAKKTLVAVIKKCAGDIRSKYVSPPHTTNFGIMFLPFEGLYAEAVNLGLVETLQREYSVSITGPSTMAAMLNSLQMGFRTLAIQKRSNEVWEILGSVKKEFGNFSDALEKTQKHIRQVDDDLEKLIGTRTRQINRSLSKVELPSCGDDTPSLLDTE
jgi:DNA recombination protein RmuC